MTKLRVGHKVYTIEQRDHGLTDDPCHGLCDPDSSRILLSDKLTGTDELETLLHEVMHAVWAMWNMRDEAGEEETVTTMAKGLTTVFLANPWLIEKLKK